MVILHLDRERKKTGNGSDTNKTKSGDGNDDQPPLPKSWKYADAYLNLGFTGNVAGDEWEPDCLLSENSSSSQYETQQIKKTFTKVI